MSDLERFDVALRDIAYDVEKLGDFIRRPDLNADNIRLLDSWGKKLHELVAESTALLDRVDAARALCAGHTGRTHDTYDEGWVDALNHIADALGGSS